MCQQRPCRVLLIASPLQAGPNRTQESRAGAVDCGLFLHVFWLLAQVLSDFIVENRGIVPKSLKSASDNIEQVNQIIKTSNPACTQPDPAGASTMPLVLRAICPCHFDYHDV